MNGTEHVTFTGYLILSSGKPSFVRFDATIVASPNSGNVTLFGSERKYNTEKVTEFLNHKVLAKQYDMVTYLVGDSYRVVIGDAANVKKGSIFPDRKYGNYTRYLQQQVLPVADPEIHDIRQLKTALSPETIKRELSARDDYTVDLTCRIDGEIYNKRFTFYLADPEAEFYLLLKSDVTDVLKEEREKNQMLAVALKEAESANAAKTAFLSSMSHEIRTPMNAIIGLGNLALQSPSLQDETRDYLEKIGASARHLLGIINDILDMSRIESGKATLKMEEFSFADLLKQISTLVQTQCDDKGLLFQSQILGSLKKRYIGDDTKLRQVLINILSNAIKFTDAPGTVKFSVEQTADFESTATLRFIVEDTGIGMDKDFIPKIFEAFSQENSGRTNRYGSTGLGMAITASLVDMMNGTIEVDSEKGKGTRFTVTVSLRNVAEDDFNQNAIGTGDMKVLVVDEDPIACAQAKLALDDAGIASDCLYSHDEIIRTLEISHGKSEPYNLLLMDWKLPGADGIALTKMIKQRFRNETAVLVMSSYSWEDIRDDAEKAGTDGFLSKPLAAQDAASKFRQVLSGRRSAQNSTERKATLEGRRILLAEDIAINAEIMKKLLSMRGMTVDHAENGSVAVDMFQNSEHDTYSAVLMDVRMPVMDGLAAASAIRKLKRDDAAIVPIIAMTANAFDEDVQLSLQAGMNAHLSKPVNPTLLYDTLETLIGASRLKHD
ncbi:MAG: response regulator [Succinivibrionaceae bacterium]|nr:response regulator [Succinivibrionaceae bacterium]